MAMCFGLLPATAWAAEEEVAIDESNFPNKTFRNYIQKVFDKDNNDFFSADEIAAVTELTFQYPDDPNTGVAGITSLKGIEYFTALTSLDCSYQDLTELDLSRNTGLTSVLCYGNQLTELDLSANTQLIELDCMRLPIWMSAAIIISKSCPAIIIGLPVWISAGIIS